jgi:propionate catabolism operon transcriptional regulator
MEDIPELQAPLLNAYQKPSSCITPVMIERIESYAWPGNIRELNSLVESYLILLGNRKSDPTLFFELFEEYCAPLAGFPPLRAEHQLGRSSQTAGDKDRARPSLAVQMEARKRQIIRETLQRCANNKTLAAKQLGISTHTLWRALKTAPQ